MVLLARLIIWGLSPFFPLSALSALLPKADEMLHLENHTSCIEFRLAANTIAVWNEGKSLTYDLSFELLSFQNRSSAGKFTVSGMETVHREAANSLATNAQDAGCSSYTGNFALYVAVSLKTKSCFDQNGTLHCIDANENQRSHVRVWVNMSADLQTSEGHLDIPLVCVNETRSGSRQTAWLIYESRYFTLAYAHYVGKESDVYEESCRIALGYDALPSIGNETLPSLAPTMVSVTPTPRESYSLDQPRPSFVILSHSMGYAVNRSEITRLEHGYCGSAQNCTSCTDSDCGWCIWQSRCTFASHCDDSSNKDNRLSPVDSWIPTYHGELTEDECPYVYNPFQARITLMDDNRWCWTDNASPGCIFAVFVEASILQVQLHIDNWKSTRRLPDFLTCYYESPQGDTWKTRTTPSYSPVSNKLVRILCPCPVGDRWTQYVTKSSHGQNSSGHLTQTLSVAVGQTRRWPLFEYLLTIHTDGIHEANVTVHRVHPPADVRSPEVLTNEPKSFKHKAGKTVVVTLYGVNLHEAPELRITFGTFNSPCKIFEKLPSYVKCWMRVTDLTPPGRYPLNVFCDTVQIFCHNCSFELLEEPAIDYDNVIGMGVAVSFVLCLALCVGIILVCCKVKRTSRSNRRLAERLGTQFSAQSTLSESVRKAAANAQIPLEDFASTAFLTESELDQILEEEECE